MLLGFLGDLLPEHVRLEADGHVEAVGIGSGLGPTARVCKKSGSGQAGNRITQEGSSVHEVGYVGVENRFRVSPSMGGTLAGRVPDVNAFPRRAMRVCVAN